jgi:hypothetical protein
MVAPNPEIHTRPRHTGRHSGSFRQGLQPVDYRLDKPPCPSRHPSPGPRAGNGKTQCSSPKISRMQTSVPHEMRQEFANGVRGSAWQAVPVGNTRRSHLMGSILASCSHPQTIQRGPPHRSVNAEAAFCRLWTRPGGPRSEQSDTDAWDRDGAAIPSSFDVMQWINLLLPELRTQIQDAVNPPQP